jgi:1-phosphofructokinase
MIFTITLSPTFDLTYHVDDLVTDQVNRVGRKIFEPSGKGINVSIDLAEEQFQTLAIAPVPDSELGDLWISAASEKMIISTSKSGHEIRINTSIIGKTGVTKINENFEKLSSDELKDLVGVIEKEAKEHKPKWIALCGSVHLENAEALGQALRRICDSVGAKLAIDTSGEAAEILFKFAPDFIKPNRDEISVWYPEASSSDQALISSIQDLAKRINGTVLCTNGGKTAYASNNKNLLEIVPPTIAAVNSVGAGDASLAGFLAAESSGSDFVTAVSMAMMWAIASCQNSKSAGLNLKAASGASASIKELVQ